MKQSSSPNFLRSVFVESFMAKRVMRVQTTIASSIQEITFMMVPRSAMGADRRLYRACTALSSILSVGFNAEAVDSNATKPAGCLSIADAVTDPAARRSSGLRSRSLEALYP